MKRKPFLMIGMLAVMAMLGLTGCSKTVEDVANWKAAGNIEKLIKALGDPKMEVRLAASEALGELKAEPAIDGLANLFNDPEPEVVLSAVQSLSQIGTPGITTPMVAALSLDQSKARMIGAVKLGELKAVGGVAALSEALNDSESDIQLTAATSLGLIGDEGGSKALVTKLSDPSTEMRKICTASLGETGGALAAEGLIGALADSDADVVRTATASLINLGDTSVPFALQGLRNTKIEIRRGALLVLRKLKAIPEEGDDSVWYLLARVSVSQEDQLDENVIRSLHAKGAPAIDPLLAGAAHSDEKIREHAILALEHFGEEALQPALKAASNGNANAKSWMDSRTEWAGAPSWKIDLWTALASLNPDFNLDSGKTGSLDMLGRPAFNVIVNPQFTPSREYVPYLITLLGDTTAPPPAEPDYDADGIPIVKKKHDMFRGEANQQISKEKLKAAGRKAALPLLAAIEDKNELLAGHAATLLGDQGDKRALEPLMDVVGSKLAASENLSDSPFYIALQKMDDASAEPLLLQVRPNADRAMRIFHRQYPDIRPMSAETKDTWTDLSAPVTYRLGFIFKGRVGEFEYTFAKNDEGNWYPSPALPEQVPEF